jgi:hypothetical protein
MEKGTQTWFATILGAVLLLVGIIGFINNPVLGLFPVNGLHNAVHLLTGLVFLGVGVWGSMGSARTTNKVLGIVYLLVAIVGFVWGLSFLQVGVGNDPDNYLHLLLGIAPLAVGFWAKD